MIRNHCNSSFLICPKFCTYQNTDLFMIRTVIDHFHEFLEYYNFDNVCSCETLVTSSSALNAVQFTIIQIMRCSKWARKFIWILVHSFLICSVSIYLGCWTHPWAVKQIIEHLTLILTLQILEYWTLVTSFIFWRC